MQGVAHLPAWIFLVICATCAVAGNVAWFRISESVNDLQVLPQRNPFFQRMPLSMSRQFMRQHARAFPKSKLRLVVRLAPFLLFASFFLFIAQDLSSSPKR